MHYQRFLEQLPQFFHDWGFPSIRSRSPIFAHVLQRVRGMTSANVLQLLNWAVACLEPGEAYCEIGCFQGATLIGAILDHPGTPVYAADNFSEFDPQGVNFRQLMTNLAAFNLQEHVRFFSQDFTDFLPGLRGQEVRVGVYLYDGAHDYRSQLLGLLLVVPLLAPRALIVVDDSNCAAVKQATWDFMAVQPAARLLLDLPTPGNCHPTFWNGIHVLAWETGTDNGYDRSTFKQARQPALLESLFALQAVSLQVRDGKVYVCPTE